MTLLQALVAAVEEKRPAVSNARMVFFAFAETDQSAYLSEVGMDELLPLLEKWCKEQREKNKETIH